MVRFLPSLSDVIGCVIASLPPQFAFLHFSLIHSSTHPVSQIQFQFPCHLLHSSSFSSSFYYRLNKYLLLCVSLLAAVHHILCLCHICYFAVLQTVFHLRQFQLLTSLHPSLSMFMFISIV